LIWSKNPAPVGNQYRQNGGIISARQLAELEGLSQREAERDIQYFALTFWFFFDQTSILNKIIVVKVKGRKMRP